MFGHRLSEHLLPQRFVAYDDPDIGFHILLQYRSILSLCTHCGYSHKIVTIFPMYEPSFMACDVAVTRCIIVALERYMSRPWLIEKIQILVWHKHLHCSLIDDLTISIYGYRIRYLVESNCEGEDYLHSSSNPQSSIFSESFNKVFVSIMYKITKYSYSF